MLITGILYTVIRWACSMLLIFRLAQDGEPACLHGESSGAAICQITTDSSLGGISYENAAASGRWYPC